MVKTRKFFAMAIVFSMILTLFAGIATVSAADAPDYSSSMERMKKFNVIIGDPDGQLRPEADVLRSEFLTILVRALGYEDAASAAKGVTRFTDVPAEHWASGYINVAVSLGITVGTTETTFSPDDKVELIEAIAMIERAMGYEVVAQEKGGYPVGHLVVAKDKNLGLNLMDGVTQSPVLPASRGLVAKLFDNGLAAPFYEIDSYSNGVPTYKQNKNVTFLSKLGFEKLQIVDGEDSFILAMTPNYGADENKVKLLSITNRNAGETGLVEKELNGNFDLDSFMGKRIEAYVDGDGKIIDIQLAEADKTTEVVAVEISKDGNKIKIKDEEGTETKYEVQKGLLPYVANWTFGVAENANAFDNNGAFGDNTGLIEARAVIYDGKVDFVYGYRYDDPGLVSQVVNNTVTGAQRIVTGAGTYHINKDKDNKAKFVEIIKNGEAVELNDIKENEDIAYVAAQNEASADNAKDNRIRILVVNDTVTGELKGITYDKNDAEKMTKVRIDSTSYDVYAPTKFDKVKVGDTVLARLTKDGKVLELEFEDGSVEKDYAIILYKWTEKDSKTQKNINNVTLLTSDGDEIDYKIEKDSNADKEFANFTKGNLIKYELNSDNKIVKMEHATAANANDVADSEKKRVAGMVADSDIILFNISDYNAEDDTKEVEANIVTWNNLKDKTTVAEYFAEDGYVVAAKLEGAASDVRYGVITDRYTIKDGKAHLALITADGVVEYDSKDAVSAEYGIGSFVAFSVDANNKIIIDAEETNKIDVLEATVDGKTINVFDIESVDSANIKVNGTPYGFADEVVVYYNENLDATEDFEEMSVEDLYKFMQVQVRFNSEGDVIGVAVSSK
ncbi:MAG: S-layer homology domain-containing protein [Clostridiaceae bacterium]|nr:S-layer homology domain-containing protein [Clostridiaceae bacterium]